MEIAHRNICLIPASAHGTNPASASDGWNESDSDQNRRKRKH